MMWLLVVILFKEEDFNSQIVDTEDRLVLNLKTVWVLYRSMVLLDVDQLQLQMRGKIVEVVKHTLE